MDYNYKRIGQILNNLIKLRDGFAENLRPVSENFQEISIVWSNAVSEFIVKHKEYMAIEEKASLIATKYDWFISYDFYIGKDFFQELIDLNDTNPGIDTIDNLFIKHYSMNVFSDLMDYLKNTKITKEYEEILNQIELGYQDKLFYLVVPILFTVIEGIIAKSFNHEGKMNGKQLKNYINKLLGNSNIRSVQEVIDKRMFISFEHGDEIDSPISRHAILHGGDISYGTEAIALRLCLILYNLVILIDINKDI